MLFLCVCVCVFFPLSLLCVSGVVAFWALAATAHRDPGIAVWRLPPRDQEAGRSGARRTGDNDSADDSDVCKVCDIVREDIRTEHCDFCEVCVLGMDHHCPWMSQCVAQGNVTSFYVFLLSFAVFLATALTMFLSTIGHHPKQPFDIQP